MAALDPRLMAVFLSIVLLACATDADDSADGDTSGDDGSGSAGSDGDGSGTDTTGATGGGGTGTGGTDDGGTGTSGTDDGGSGPGEGKIIFASDHGTDPTGTAAANVFAMNPDGTDVVDLTDTWWWDSEPDWSWDRSRIAFVSDRNIPLMEVLVMNADGSDQAPAMFNIGGGASPTFSPDDGMLAFALYSPVDWSADIYAVPLGTEDLVALTELEGTVNGSPNYSPDGTRIVFESDRDGNFEIYTMNSDGSDQTRLTETAEDEHSPRWSPDGTRIAYTLDDGNDGEIHVMDADGSNTTALTDNDASDGRPAWSPDGTRIAFSTDRDGDSEIYVMGADGSEPVNLTQRPADDWGPSWR